MLHLGVALGRRVVVLAQGKSPRETWPYGHPEWVVAAPGGTLADVEVERVVEATGAALRDLLLSAAAAR